MQIGDIFSKFQNTVNTAENTQQNQAVQNNSRSGNIDASLLTKGNVFEGTVTENARGQLTISLSNGQTLNARLDEGVTVKTGEPLFFQVIGKNGSDATQIRLYQGQVTNNPAITNALNAAGLTVNGTSVTMVQTMMANQMSIDKNSLLAMAKTISDYSGTQVNTLVDMAKLNIPITAENITQFENYANDNKAVIATMESMLDSVPELLSSDELTKEQAIGLTLDIIDIFKSTGANAEDLSTDGKAADAKVLLNNTPVQGESYELPATNTAEDVEAEGKVDITQAAATQSHEVDINSETIQTAKNEAASGEVDINYANSDEGDIILANFENTEKSPADAAASTGKAAEFIPSQQSLENVNLLELPVSSYISSDDAKTLSSLLLELAQSKPEATALLDEEGNLSSSTTGKAFMNALSEILKDTDNITPGQLKSLLSNKAFKTTLFNVMQRQWMISPKDVEVEGRVKDLYERLNRQMERFEQAFSKVGTDGTNKLSQQAHDMRQNILFMNQINQNYTYLQIPLRMMNQNAHSDLYVYSNKKHMSDDGTLSAFLHLDMDNLGSTDISIKMKDKNVSTNFFLEDESAFDLIEEHIDELTNRLKDRGYNVTSSVTNEAQKTDFVNDFLKEGQSAGTLHRYSFDVMA